MAKAYQIHPNSASHSEYSTSILENLTIQTTIKPQPGPKSVLVRVRAAALNFRDLLVIADSPNYTVRTTPGLVPCSDGAGEIEAVGPGSKWHIGDKIILRPNQSWLESEDVGDFDISKALGGGAMPGTLQQYIVVGDDWLAKMPENLSFEEAAALPTAGGTAVNALFHAGLKGLKEGNRPLEGKTILTQGTGGVSCFAIQIASKAGARVISTSSTEEKLQAAKAIGATDLINYKKTADWADEVLKLTGGKGVDLVVEVGGAATVEQSLKAARLGGTIVVIGILSASKQSDLVPEILFGAKTVCGHLGCNKTMVDELVDLVEKHDIHPVVGQTFAWEEAPAAFESMMKQGTVGRIVVKI